LTAILFIFDREKFTALIISTYCQCDILVLEQVFGIVVSVLSYWSSHAALCFIM